MPKHIINTNKGVVLIMVLSMILVVVALANIVILLISSQYRLTHHQASRIQAYYAAQAGMVLALENLRTGAWSVGTDCTAILPCSHTFEPGDFYPASIQNNAIQIIIIPVGSAGCLNPPGNCACVKVDVDYTYTP
jgi:Tfp pilus assembly protein PilX